MSANSLSPLAGRPSHHHASDTAYVAYLEGSAMDVHEAEHGVAVHDRKTGATSFWVVQDTPDGLTLGGQSARAGGPDERHLLAVLEAVFSRHPQHASVVLDSVLPRGTGLVESGIVQLSPRQVPRVSREVLWQIARLWSPAERTPYPLSYAMTQGRRHPHRPPKPTGTVYRRHIPWLNTTLSFRAVNVERDLDAFHRWMNDPMVAEFWQEEGDLAKHRAYLETIARDPHAVSLVGSFGDDPFGYFEVYWAKEDRIAPFYDADEFDRGWHVLVGEPRYRGRPFLTAWMPSMSHHLFLDDPRTQRIVIEPRLDNRKMIHSLERCGYASVKAFQFPHKRAMLGMLLRERFFGDALWFPQSDDPRRA